MRAVSFKSSEVKDYLHCSQFRVITNSAMRPSILLFGDSLTQQAFGKLPETRFGWASLLASEYTRRADVLNRGFSGYSTKHALDILPTSIKPVLRQQQQKEKEILFCTIFFGANDSAHEGTRQHIPLNEYTSNIKTIVNYMKSEGAAGEEGSDFPIILMTPPPVDDQKWNDYCVKSGRKSFDRSNKSSKSYGQSLIENVGKELKLPVLDVFDLLKGNDGVSSYQNYLSDGLHLTEEGNTMIFEGLMNLIKENFPHLMPAPDKGYHDDGKDGVSPKGVPVQEKDWTLLC